MLLLIAIGLISKADNVDWPASMASGTLPIVYVDTDGKAPIEDKVTLVPAAMYITVPDNCDYPPLANKDNQIRLTIRGRGNQSWTLDKKPYKIKFDTKTEVFGMPKNKHFALIPFVSGYYTWLASFAGYELGRMMGMAWVPRMQPCELVLNGSYEGMYFFMETVKVGKHRVDIFEQPDLCEDPKTIDGGWLVEIDNWIDENQIVIQEAPSKKLRVTHKAPEELNHMQESYLRQQFEFINRLIYESDHAAITLDFSSLARYVIVRELLHDPDAYTGSFFFHKDLDKNAKWICGPLWDLSCGGKKNDWIMNDHPANQQVHWITPLFSNRDFCLALNEEWQQLMEKIDDIYPYIIEKGELCQYADAANHARWPDSSGNTHDKIYSFVHILKDNVQWISEHLPEVDDVKPDSAQSDKWYSLDGTELIGAPKNNRIYIHIDRHGIHKVYIDRTRFPN